MSIPKIIHQVWINDTWKDSSLKKDVPEKWKKSQQEWQRLHPDWTYILWTDDLVLSFIEKNYPEYLEFYKNYEYLIQRADMIRYFILYDFGGVYCDLDLYPVENIEKYITTNLNYFIYSAGSDILTNAFMISPKKSEIMKLLYESLKEYNDNIPLYCIGKHLKVMFTTGPNFFNNVIINNNLPYVILPRTKFYPYSSSEDKYITDNKDIIVIMPIEDTSGSWHEIDSKIYVFVNKNKVFFIIFGILSILCIIIGLIYYMIKYKKCRESKVCIK
jgi:mannosyltransferase OCH1-like enzyme